MDIDQRHDGAFDEDPPTKEEQAIIDAEATDALLKSRLIESGADPRMI